MTLHHVELVSVELGQQGHDLAHSQVVVVLDGEELLFGLGPAGFLPGRLVLGRGGHGLGLGALLAQLGDPIDDRHPAPAGPLVTLHHVELVSVELGQQGHDLAHTQVVVVLDGEEVVLGHRPGPFARRGRAVLGRTGLDRGVPRGSPTHLVDAVQDRHPTLGRPLSRFHHVELVGIELGQQRQDLHDLEIVVVLDGKEVVLVAAGGRATHRGQDRTPGCGGGVGRFRRRRYGRGGLRRCRPGRHARRVGDAGRLLLPGRLCARVRRRRLLTGTAPHRGHHQDDAGQEAAGDRGVDQADARAGEQAEHQQHGRHQQESEADQY